MTGPTRCTRWWWRGGSWRSTRNAALRLLGDDVRRHGAQGALDRRDAQDGDVSAPTLISLMAPGVGEPAFVCPLRANTSTIPSQTVCPCGALAALEPHVE